MITCLLSFALFLAPLTSLPAPGLEYGPAAAGERGHAAADLDADVDRALHWLRAQQDLKSGSYGSAQVTLQVLVAMATSHRAYDPTDGPFIAKALDFLLASQAADGSFPGESDEYASRLRATQLTIHLLERFGVHAPARARALAFLGAESRGSLDPYAKKWSQMPADARKLELLGKRIQGLLAERQAAGHWQDARGGVLATAASVSELSSLARILKSMQSQAAPPTSASPLPSFEASLEPAALARAQKSMLRGADFLLAQAIEPGRWGFQGQADPGISAMACTALLGLREPRPEAVQASIDRCIPWLLSFQQADGSIHAGQLPNYVTSASLMALTRADRKQHEAAIARARDFLVRLQADEGEGYSPTDRFYGGVGYGGDERPDLSNMNMALEALVEAGLQPGDETFVKALSFLQRCQNRSESNPMVLVVDGDTLVSGDDGGAAYAPGQSKAGLITLRDGRKMPRSYGSMTYALLKGYLFAGLPKDDARVEAAWKWLCSNYTLDVNPGFEDSSDPTAGYQGLFYYFTSMSKALDLYDQKLVTDRAGREHDWRAELIGRLLSLQRQDGSWINNNAPRWYEGNPVLASSYALLSLSYALPGK